MLPLVFKVIIAKNMSVNYRVHARIILINVYLNGFNSKLTPKTYPKMAFFAPNPPSGSFRFSRSNPSAKPSYLKNVI